MKKSRFVLLGSIFYILFGITFTQHCLAAKYYVRVDGNDNNTGLANSATGAWRSVNTALYGYGNYGAGPGGSGIPMLAGDTLFVGDGVFIEDGYTYGLKIDGINGSGTKPFVMMAFHKGMAKLQLSSQFNCFNISNSKGVVIDGFDVYCAAGSTNIYSGFSINSPSEFVTIRNCKIHNFGLGGVGGNGDNIIIENNEVYDNSIRNPGNGSGINFYHPLKTSTTTLTGGYGHIIRNNFVHDNYCNQYYTNANGNYGPPTDGNGIIIDDWNFTQGGGTPYTVPTLIENNICVHNGGSGIRVYDSDNITVRNNTCYFNCWVTANYSTSAGTYAGGDIGAICETGKEKNITLVNNICIADTATIANNNGLAIGDAITNGVVTNNYSNKIFFLGGNLSLNTIGNNPQFLHAGIDPATANFHVQTSSATINIGLNSNAPLFDYDGVARPQNGIVDAGAYETLNTVLPINKIVFSVALLNNAVALSWQVDDETTVGYYEIQRSVDANDFKETLVVQPTKSLNYIRYDPIDLLNTATIYYRLKIVEKNSTFRYSTIQKVNVPMVTNNPATISPNPNQGNFTVHLPQGVYGDADFTIQINNSLGQTVLVKNYKATTANPIVVTGSGVLKNGLYYLAIIQKDKRFNVPFVVDN